MGTVHLVLSSGPICVEKYGGASSKNEKQGSV